jgi:hypothetical protein
MTVHERYYNVSIGKGFLTLISSLHIRSLSDVILSSLKYQHVANLTEEPWTLSRGKNSLVK